MKDLIKAIDNLPWIVKLILCIPVLDIVWAVYRIMRSIDRENLIGIVLSILCIVPGAAFVWVFDLICVALNKKVWWIC